MRLAVLAQSSTFTEPLLSMLQCEQFPEKMRSRDRVAPLNTQIEIGIAMVNFFQMR
jgi:hypothetical protein